MAAIGADPEALEAVARTFRSVSDELDRVVRSVDTAIGRARWIGSDAERFGRDWQALHRRSLHDGSARCRTLAERVVAHAAQQRRASLSTAGTSLPPRSGPTTVLHGTVGASLGIVSASASGTLTVSASGSERTVTFTDARSGGVGVTVGSGLHAAAGDTVVGTGATAGVFAGVDNRTTRTWTVPASGLTSLLLALGVEQELSHSPAAAFERSVAQGLRGLRTIGDVVGLGLPGVPASASSVLLPPPRRTEDLLGIAVGASAWAALGGGPSTSPTGAEGTASGRLAVGAASEGSRRSVVLEAEGSAAVGIVRATPLLLGARRDGVAATSRLRIEVPVGRADGRPLLATLTSTDGDGEDVVQIAVEPSVAGPALRAARTALDAARRGDLPRAVRALGRVVAPEHAVQIDAARTVLRSSRLDAGAVAGTGSLELTGRVEHRRPAP